MKKIAVLLLLVTVSVLAFAAPSFAIENTKAVREPDGSVKITWENGEPGKNLTIKYRYGENLWVNLASVPQTDGRYVHREPPAVEVQYMLSVGAFSNIELTAPAFGNQNQNGNGAAIEDKGGMFERAIAEVFNGLARVFEVLIGSAGLKTINEVIFPSSDQEVSLESPQPWDASRWQLLDRLYLSFFAATFPLCLIVVVLTALKMIRAGALGNSQERSESMETIWRWVMAVVIIFATPLMLRAMFFLDNALVEAFRGATSSLSAANMKVLDGSSAVVNLRTGSVLGTAIVKFYLLGVEFWLNIIFYIRDWVLMTFYIFTPVMVWLWALNKNITAYSVWFGELLTNSFLHSAYALAFCVIVTFLSAEANIPWPQKVVGATMLITLGGVLRNLLQDIWTRLSGVQEESVAGRVMGVLGFGGILGLHKVGAASMAGIGGSSGFAPGSAAGGSPLPLGGGPGGPAFSAGTAAGDLPGGTAGGFAANITGGGSQGAVPGGLAAQGSFASPGGSLPLSPGSMTPPRPGTVPPITSAISAGGVSKGGILLPPGAGGPQEQQDPTPAQQIEEMLNTGKITQGVFQLGAAAVSAPLSIMPGGDQLRRFIVGAAGVTGKAVGTAGSVIGQSYARAKESAREEGGTVLGRLPGSVKESLKEMTNTKYATLGSLKLAGLVAGDYAMPRMSSYITKKTLDGYRFRP